MRKSKVSRWHVIWRTVTAIFLGYLTANTVGLFAVFAIPMDRLTAVATWTILSFALWAACIMYVFAAKRLRVAALSLLAISVVSGGAAYGLFLLESASA